MFDICPQTNKSVSDGGGMHVRKQKDGHRAELVNITISETHK